MLLDQTVLTSTGNTSLASDVRLSVINIFHNCIALQLWWLITVQLLHCYLSVRPS